MGALSIVYCCRSPACSMESDEVIQLFTECGALLEGHFMLSSGLHSRGYLQCALVLQHPVHTGVLGAALAERVRVHEPTVVLSPALGGVIIGHAVARVLGVRALFAERRDERMFLRRGFHLEPDDRVVIVEDVVTTGGSTRETMDVARAVGVRVVGAAAIIDRSGSTVAFDVPFDTLATVSWQTYVPGACPQCVAGIPVTKPGSRVQPAAS